MKQRWILWGALLWLGVGGAVGARGDRRMDDPRKVEAEALAQEAKQLAEAGDLAGAIDRLTRSESLWPDPAVHRRLGELARQQMLATLTRDAEPAKNRRQPPKNQEPAGPPLLPPPAPAPPLPRMPVNGPAEPGGASAPALLASTLSGALIAGEGDRLIGLLHPRQRDWLGGLFGRHRQDWARVGQALAAGHLLGEQGATAEFEAREGELGFTVIFAKEGTQWFLWDL